MLCDICQKREATIHIKGIIGNLQKTLNLCAECAAEQEKTAGINFGSLNLAEMLMHLNPSAAKPHPAAPEPVCPHCGWSGEKLRKSGGKLGCADCYRTFAELLAPLLKQVQQGDHHVGKHPGVPTAGHAAALLAEIARCRSQMDAMIRAENYEEAAALRDRIRELQSELDREQHHE
ncbi:MAG: UvrB/UvrC motif-containing protein [Lentisphaeria bacterium]|nr:UvrB/UvrC motif-containing protein [Lentisphaeria bacterium]